MITIYVCLQRLGKSQQPAQKFLVLNLLVYIYDAQGDMFKPLPDVPWDLPQQILDANKALQRIAAGHPLLMLSHAVNCAKCKIGSRHMPDFMTDVMGILLQDTCSVLCAYLHWEQGVQGCRHGPHGGCHAWCTKGLPSCTNVLHMEHI